MFNQTHTSVHFDESLPVEAITARREEGRIYHGWITITIPGSAIIFHGTSDQLRRLASVIFDAELAHEICTGGHSVIRSS